MGWNYCSKQVAPHVTQAQSYANADIDLAGSGTVQRHTEAAPFTRGGRKCPDGCTPTQIY